MSDTPKPDHPPLDPHSSRRGSPHSSRSQDDVSSLRPVASSQGRTGMTDDLLLTEAGRVFEQLRIRLNELEHRERKLDEKVKSVDQRQHDFSRWVKQTQHDLATREEQIAQRETTAEHLEQRLAADTSRLQADREQFQQDQQHWEQQRQQQEQINRETEQELNVLRETRMQEISRSKQEADELIAAKTAEFEEYCRIQLEQISQQQAQTTRRLKLQEDHLARMRHQLELHTKQTQRDTQQSQQTLQFREQQNRRRNQQLTRARLLLDQRAEALSRQEVLVQEQIHQQRQQITEREAELERDQQEWFVSRQQIENRLQDQQDLLNRQQDFILNQQERLQNVRTEIENTHRNTLLMRLQTEAFRSEIAVETGQHFDQTHQQELQQQIADLQEQSQGQLNSLRDALQQDYRSLHELLQEIKQQESAVRRWMTDGLIKWEHQKLLAQQSRDQLVQERERWSESRQSHIDQSRQAELVIRKLLDELEESNQQGANLDEMVSPERNSHDQAA